MNANWGLATIAGAPQRRRFRLRASSRRAWPAASELAIGFSLQTCLPASSARRLRCSCSCMSVRSTSRSNGAPARSRSTSRVSVGDAELLGLGRRPLGDDVAGADQLDVRAPGEVRQVGVRDAPAPDHAHLHPPQCGSSGGRASAQGADARATPAAAPRVRRTSDGRGWSSSRRSLLPKAPDPPGRGRRLHDQAAEMPGVGRPGRDVRGAGGVRPDPTTDGGLDDASQNSGPVGTLATGRSG